ncbi:hypothetical protein SELMODRAFT_106578, partial [Selaginella moellendorffii]
KLDIALDIAQGLHYIHYEFDSTIIHSDFKPENVLLDQDFTACMTDFGISRLVQDSNNIATVSTFKGTIGYAHQ